SPLVARILLSINPRDDFRGLGLDSQCGLHPRFERLHGACLSSDCDADIVGQLESSWILAVQVGYHKPSFFHLDDLPSHGRIAVGLPSTWGRRSARFHGADRSVWFGGTAAGTWGRRGLTPVRRIRSPRRR